MKTTTHYSRAFTLIEMLVVIAIIGILAGILLPVLNNATTKAKNVQAQSEITTLAGAINAYQAQYGLYPCEDVDAKAGKDITFENDNSTVIVILMDLDQGVNAAHVRNPQKHVFLNVKTAKTATSPGVSTNDYCFRDPWGRPYGITLDLNYDNQCESSVAGTVRKPVAVWSLGKDGNSKTLIKSW